MIAAGLELITGKKPPKPGRLDVALASPEVFTKLTGNGAGRKSMSMAGRTASDLVEGAEH